MSDIFEAFGDVFGGTIFEDFFGGRGGGRGRVRKGADLRCNVTLELEEAARGVKKTLSLTRHVACGSCEGSGAAKVHSPKRVVVAKGMDKWYRPRHSSRSDDVSCLPREWEDHLEPLQVLRRERHGSSRTKAGSRDSSRCG